MGLETGTFISDLVVTNPPTSDLVSQGDDHLRLIKNVLKNTFPTASKAFYNPTTVGASGNFTVAATQMNCLITCDTTAGAMTVTLPTLTSGDAGFVVHFMKSDFATTNPVFLQPASGNLVSGPLGLSKTRRGTPGVVFSAIWLGTFWVTTRCYSVPVGSLIPYAGSVLLPVGLEWPNGQTLSSAANYPDYNAIRGSLTTPDVRGRVIAGKDDMGGSSANRLTAATAQGVNGDTFEATGGEEAHTQLNAEVGVHTHTATQAAHDHTWSPTNINNFTPSGGVIPGGTHFVVQNGNGTTSSAQPAITVNNTASPNPMNTLQPTIIETYLLVVE